MDLIKINGDSYDVSIRAIEENFNILYSENTGRSADARMILDPLGTFFGHKVVFARKKSGEPHLDAHFETHFDRLFEVLSQPVYDGFKIEAIHGQDKITYTAYVSQGSRSVKKVDPNSGKVYWDEFEVNFIPMEAQVTP